MVSMLRMACFWLTISHIRGQESREYILFLTVNGGLCHGITSLINRGHLKIPLLLMFSIAGSFLSRVKEIVKEEYEGTN